LQQNTGLFVDIKESALDFKYPEIDNVDVDASLYQAGFMSYTEQTLCEHFHKRDLSGKVKLMPEMNRSYYERALRIIGRIAPEVLTVEMQGEFQEYLERVASFEPANMPLDFKGGHKTSIPEVYERIQKLREGVLSEEQLYLLDELEGYLSL
jgi:exodeoxyribonuclease-1